MIETAVETAGAGVTDVNIVEFDRACEDVLQISKRTGERLLRRNEIPQPFRIGRQRYYRKADLVRWLNARAEAALAA